MKPTQPGSQTPPTPPPAQPPMQPQNGSIIGGTTGNQSMANEGIARRFERSLLKDADGLVNSERPSKYGPVGEHFTKVGQQATLMMSAEQLSCGRITAQMVVKVMIAVKQIRDTYSPDNPDHVRDACGYNELLDQLRQLGIE